MSQGNGLGLWKTREPVRWRPVTFSALQILFTAEIAENFRRGRREDHFSGAS